MQINIPIVFVSSFSDKSIDILNQADIVGFLEKPPQKNELKSILNNKNLLIKSSKKIDKIIIPIGQKEFFFDKDEIYCVKSDGKYKKFLDERGELINHIEMSFDELEKILIPHGFQKVSKSYIINVEKIREKNNVKVVLKNKVEIDIGKNDKETILEKLSNFFKR